MTVILAIYTSILNPWNEKNMHTYATSKEINNKIHLREVVTKKWRQWHPSDSHFQNQALNVHVLSKYDHFSSTFASILNLCWDRNVHTYITAWELTKKEFTLKRENIKEAIGIEVTLHLEI